jgi:hypothetical protein
MTINFSKCENIDEVIYAILFPNTNKEYTEKLKRIFKDFRVLDHEEGEDSVYLTNDKLKVKIRRNPDKELTEYLVFNKKVKGGEYLPEYWNNRKNSIQRVINFLNNKINES